MATYQEQIERRRIEREAKEKAEAERLAKQMTPEQIENWRQVLVRVLGPVAFIMPAEMVQQFRDRFQEGMNKDFPTDSRDDTDRSKG